MKRRKHNGPDNESYKKSPRGLSNDKIVLFAPSLLDELVSPRSVDNPPSTPPLVDLDKELLRADCIRNLRGLYEHLLLVLLDMPVPKLSFERWLSERLMLLDLSVSSVDRKSSDLSTNSSTIGEPRRDPVMPVDAEPKVSASLFKEIIEDVPTKVSLFPRHLREALDSLATWTNAAQTLASTSPAPLREVCSAIKAEQFNCAPLLQGLDAALSAADCELTEDEKRRVLAQCHETVQWTKSLRQDDERGRVVDAIKELQTALGPTLHKKLHARVELVCRLLLRAAGHFNAVLHDLQRTADEVQRQYQLVHVERTSHALSLTFKGQKVVVQTEHYNKLRALFRRTCGDNNDIVYGCLFAMLLRYEMCMSPSLPRKGSGLHAALPGTLFSALNAHFGVTTECFASPLNSFYGSYCSAYHDTDVFFGSFGSFFNYRPIAGSFEVNPPFVEEVILKCAERIDTLLIEALTEPLSFIVFIPNWEDSAGLQRMIASPFMRHNMVLREFEHSYVSGLQHQEQASYVQYKAVHATRVIFLQNELGFKKWTPSSDNLQRIRRN